MPVQVEAVAATLDGSCTPQSPQDISDNPPPGDRDPLTLSMADVSEGPGDRHMALYEDEFHRRPVISKMLTNLVNYEGGLQQNVSSDVDAAVEKPSKESKLGTVLGVYFPCIQNIFGVILFIRLVWIVGMAGIIQGFLIVLICCCTTMLTAISMSAIATNGVVAGGGSYFMISRALGPEFGGAVGILFYLGTSVASSMYIIGAVEILLNYVAPPLVLFGPITDQATAFNNYRIYGSILLFIMFVWVFLGVKFVSKFSPIALACVIISIVSIYTGVFVARANHGPQYCLLGKRMLSLEVLTANYSNPNGTGVEYACNIDNIRQFYCLDDDQESQCYANHNDANLTWGIPGIKSDVFKRNLFSRYASKGELVAESNEKNVHGESDAPIGEKGDILADVTSSFVILLAIFFPSVTGIMAGSNRSGDLADAQKSIPIGTISAILTTSFVYLSTVLLFGAVVEPNMLMDKFGETIGGKLIVAELAWPSPWVILIGSLLSTIGAGLQSLTGAPRLLQAIAADNVIPFLSTFKDTTKRGEPLKALLLTAFISELGVLIASLDSIAPIITMFFLMCYGFVNLACALQTLLKTPNWRPRFRFYHWILSLLGLSLCVALMFISSWYYALVAIAIAAGIYKYIEYKGAEKEWGDGIRGLAMSAARFALHRLEEGPPHVKNWRPQLLVLLKVQKELEVKNNKMLTFCSQLKAGKGLTLVATVLEGQLRDRFAEGQSCLQTIRETMKKAKVKGFCEMLVSTNISDGLSSLVQTSGIGSMRHNTVVMGWPVTWRQKSDPTAYRSFIDTLHTIAACHLAVLIPKGIDLFPDNSQRVSGTVDVWWIVHDGGLLMLLPFLLTQHKVWKNCKMRIFTVAQMDDNSIQMKKDLQTFLYHLRLKAEVAVIEMPDNDISAYTYEKTLVMEQRIQMLKEMKLKEKDVNIMPQAILDVARNINSPTKSSENATAETPVIKIQVDVIPEDQEIDLTPSPSCKLTVGEQKNSNRNQFTFTGSDKLLGVKPDNRNVRHMHTAVRLNEVIVSKSNLAQLVILNLPGPPANRSGEQNYMEFLEVLTEGLDRILMVRGSGREVITIYS